ncbi:hypothetical protein SAMN05661080_05169 [Modestobacter sp. DSM 44400]|nr:hypothetical protein SAMN05661080_05169 [Modestobacter sp. DSM 44400]
MKVRGPVVFMSYQLVSLPPDPILPSALCQQMPTGGVVRTLRRSERGRISGSVLKAYDAAH